MIDQGELFTIPNPCRGICTANNRGYCKGCLRSRKERFHWNEFSPFQQQQVINLCEQRRLKILAAKHEAVPEEETDISQMDLFLVDSGIELHQDSQTDTDATAVSASQLVDDAPSTEAGTPPVELPAAQEKETPAEPQAPIELQTLEEQQTLEAQQTPAEQDAQAQNDVAEHADAEIPTDLKTTGTPDIAERVESDITASDITASDSTAPDDSTPDTSTPEAHITPSEQPDSNREPTTSTQTRKRTNPPIKDQGDQFDLF